jgi:hypothetical protein
VHPVEALGDVARLVGLQVPDEVPADPTPASAASWQRLLHVALAEVAASGGERLRDASAVCCLDTATSATWRLSPCNASENAPSDGLQVGGDCGHNRSTFEAHSTTSTREPPAAASSLQGQDMDIAELLAFSVKNKASDLHLSAGLPPMIRVHGDVRRINVPTSSTRTCTGWCTTS